MTQDLALYAKDPASLEAFDDPGKQIELACSRACAWLKAGVEVRIETIVETRAQAAALATFAIQKQLGRDAELAALEVQRRAERGVGLAVRRGQEAGEITSQGLTRRRPGDHVGVTDMVTVTEATGMDRNDLSDLYPMADGVSDEQFEDAIEDAKAEGNLSRANVIRKVKGVVTDRLRGEKRLDRIRERAATGHTSAQIADELGHAPDTIRDLARAAGIEIPADRIINQTNSNKRPDSTQIAREAVAAMDALVTPLRLINYNDLDPADVAEWIAPLTTAVRAINQFSRQIREVASDSSYSA